MFAKNARGKSNFFATFFKKFSPNPLKFLDFLRVRKFSYVHGVGRVIISFSFVFLLKKIGPTQKKQRNSLYFSIFLHSAPPLYLSAAQSCFLTVFFHFFPYYILNFYNGLRYNIMEGMRFAPHGHQGGNLCYAPAPTAASK